QLGVRSTACNGASTTDDDAGHGYDFRPKTPPPVPVQPTRRFFFTGQPGDQANKFANNPTATYTSVTPTGTSTITQNDEFTADPLVPGDPNDIFWTGPVTGTMTGNLILNWYWSTPNPEAVILGDAADVTLFADPDIS